MNQHKTKELRKIFNQLPTFALDDPRRNGAWRQFKASYLKMPRNKRFSYTQSLQQQATLLNTPETATS